MSLAPDISLHIIVCLKQVLDGRAGLKPGPDGRSAAQEHPEAVYTLDPASRSALELALKLALRPARQTPAKVTALALGPQSALDVLRFALARGADQAVHLACGPEIAADPWAAAALLAGEIAQLQASLVLCGDGLVGPFLAECLDLPQITRVVDAELSESEDSAATQPAVRALRALERGGRERVSCSLPAVCVSPAAAEAQYVSVHRLESVDIKRIRTQKVSAPAEGSPPKVRVSEVSLPRPRPRKMPAPAASLSAAQRINFLMGAGQAKKDSSLFEGSTPATIERIMKFLKEQGFLFDPRGEK